MNSGLKNVTLAFSDTYICSSHAGNLYNNKLVSLVNQVEKKIHLVKNSLGEIKDSLEDIKRILGSIQEMIGGVLQALAKMNAVTGFEPLIGRAASTN